MDKITRDTSPERLAKEIVDLVESIPALPLIVTYVLELTNDDDVSTIALARALEADSGLTAKVLRIANSAYYAPVERVYTVRDAIRFVGFETVRSLAVTSSVVNRLWVDDDTFTRQSFWRHSLRCGLYAREVALLMDGAHADMLFTIGVLHDIGRSALIQYDPVVYRQVIEMMRSMHIPLWQAENSILGLDHARIGGRLATKWKLPDAYASAIAFHHTPSLSDTHASFARAIELADALAHAASPMDRKDIFTPPLVPTLWEPLGLETESVKSLFARKESIEEHTRSMYETASLE